MIRCIFFSYISLNSRLVWVSMCLCFILHESLIPEPEQSDHTWALLPATRWLSAVWSLCRTECLDQDWAWYSVGHKFYSLCIGWLLRVTFSWFLPLYPCHFHHHVFCFSRMWCCVNGQSNPDVSRQHGDLIATWHSIIF